MFRRHPFATHVLRVLSILALLCSACAAQTISRFGQSPLPDQPAVDIKGTVVNSVTGEPIRRALVTMAGMSPGTAFTDDQGRFVFLKVQPGFAMLQAHRPGYFEARERGVMVHAEKTLEYELKLQPAALIYGKVTGATEESLERVPVVLIKSQVAEGRRRWVEMARKMSDADGNFRFPDLRPGIYKVAAGPVRSQDLDLLTSGYAVSYFPDVPDRDSAAAIPLQPGQQLETNFKLHSVPMFRVTGRVLGVTGPGVSLQFLDSSNMALSVPYRFIPETGEFTTANIPAGRYRLMARSMDEKQQRFAARTTIDVTGNVENVVLALHPPLTIPVVVRTNFSKPQPPQNPGSPVNPMVYARLISTTNEEVGAYSQADPAKGTVTVQDVEPGSYDVEFSPMGDWYVASAQYGSANLMREPVVVSVGKIEPIEVVLRDDAGSVEGTVRGTAEPGEVVVISDTNSNRRYHGNFGEDGRFYMSLPPGPYSAYAFDSLDSVEYANAEALAPYRSKAMHFDVPASQSAKITVDLIGMEQ